MEPAIAIFALLIIPTLGSALPWFLPSPRSVLFGLVACVSILLWPAIYLGVYVLNYGSALAAQDWFLVDALSAYHILIMTAVYFLSSVYAISYFGHEIKQGSFNLALARRFGSLWCGSLAAMTLVLISNNLGIQWVAVEATTLLTAFLICTHTSPASLEAMWKYLVICSVGVAFAFLGTLLVAVAFEQGTPAQSHLLTWTELMRDPSKLNPNLLRAGFIFLVVGYGTKVGLAPLHSWLPDAHSQAPAPVSAVFSGFLLNAALYCIMRYLPIVNNAPGLSGWAPAIMLGFGLISITVAAGFIIFQTDVKRLLAYSSIEHLGIIALGLGLGGLGTFAALFHSLNHSLSKSLAFFSAGRLGQIHGSHAIDQLSATLRSTPIWGFGLLAGFLSLIGVAPFAIFMSELQVVKAAIDHPAFLALAFFLLGTSIVFVAALRYVISMAWGKSQMPTLQVTKASAAETCLVVACVLILISLGLWLPDWLFDMLSKAAAIVGGNL